MLTIRQLCRVLVFLAAGAALAVCASPQPDVAHDDNVRPDRRLIPPATLLCARDSLTSYVGLVIEYNRTADRTSVTIRTDADTTEIVTVRHERGVAAYLLNGAPFTESDWSKVESRDGTAQPELRVAAWVCLDGKAEPVLDWRPLTQPQAQY